MLQELKILLADDEALLRLDLREMLEDAGHQIVGEASNGLEAVEMARKLKPQLVIMDVKMPVLDGLTAAKKLAEENIAPVLLLTAYSQQDIIEKAKEAGVIAYLVKPIREEQLFPAMEIAVSNFQELQQLQAELADMQEALATRKILAKAKGILMEQYGFTEQDAYRKLQQYSMLKRVSLKKLAEMIIQSAHK